MIIIMIMPCYGTAESVMMAAYYKGGKLMMTSLIIMKIRFVCFQEDEVAGSCVESRARSHDHRSCDYGVI